MWFYKAGAIIGNSKSRHGEKGRTIIELVKNQYLAKSRKIAIDTDVQCEINGISRFVSCSSAPEKGSLYAKGGKLVSPSENMDNESKETLLKVGDYNELEKQRAAKAGNLSQRKSDKLKG